MKIDFTTPSGTPDPAMNTPYTKEQISQLEAGPELDRLIAEHVMGLQNIREGWQSSDGVSYYYSDEPGDDEEDTCLIYDDEHGRPAAIPPYSEGIYCAFEVVEKMRGKQDDVRFWIASKKNGGWEVGVEPRSSLATATVEEPTLPLAICKATLLLLC